LKHSAAVRAGGWFGVGSDEGAGEGDGDGCGWAAGPGSAGDVAFEDEGGAFSFADSGIDSTDPHDEMSSRAETRAREARMRPRRAPVGRLAYDLFDHPSVGAGICGIGRARVRRERVRDLG
jgi:hypothetical protein